MKRLETEGDSKAERYANALAYLQFALALFDSLDDSVAGLHVQSAVDMIAARDARARGVSGTSASLIS